MAAGERVGPERYVKASDVFEQTKVAVCDAVRTAQENLRLSILHNLTRVATGEMRVVNENPVVLPFRSTKDCWQWMTEQRERREQAETVAQIRLEHIQALMAERDEAREAGRAEAWQTYLAFPPVKIETVELDSLQVQERIAKLQLDKDELQKLTITQGREIVGLTDQVLRQKGMIKEGWERIDTLADELSVAKKAAEKQAAELATASQIIGKKCEHEPPREIQYVGGVADGYKPPPVDHVHDQNERARRDETEKIVAECLAKILVEPPIFKK